jgi:hypothetical protein
MMVVCLVLLLMMVWVDRIVSDTIADIWLVVIIFFKRTKCDEVMGNKQ